MTRHLLFLTIAALLTLPGCANNLRQMPPPFSVAEPMAAENIWKIHYFQGNGEIFSGLLATRRQQDQLHLVLLDPTGIKLLEEEVAKTGDFRVISGVEAVQKHGFPGYLAGLCRRIFLLDPADRRDSFCWTSFEWRQIMTNIHAKRKGFGPITLWTVEYIFDDHDTLAGIVTKSIWHNRRMQLEAL